jgi:hypothetical protein
MAQSGLSVFFATIYFFSAISLPVFTLRDLCG